MTDRERERERRGKLGEKRRGLEATKERERERGTTVK